METIENMYYGIGKIALAIALADGKIDSSEINALEKRISDIKEQNHIGIDLIKTSFILNSRNKTTDYQTLLKDGIHSFYLGDLYLNDQLANLFLEVLNAVAEAKSADMLAKDEVLISFMTYLRNRANLAKFRERGYLKEVLVLVDLTETSENLISRISELEEWLRSGFRITLLHCISPNDLNGESFPSKKEEAISQLNKLIDRYFDKKKSNGKIVSEVIHERLEYIDQKYLDEKGIDFVIMNTAGKDPENYNETTRTSEHIQRHSANYLVIPDDTKIDQLSNILIVTDYTFTSIDQFEPVLELCQTTDSQVRLLYIGKRQELNSSEIEKKEALERYFGEYFSRSVFQTINETIYEDIIKYANKKKFDLLVALPKHTSFFNKFDGHLSVVKKLCQMTTKPLFVLNKHPKKLPMEKVIEERIVNK